ncbi:hypothetical protein [Enterobacter ludwigii]
MRNYTNQANVIKRIAFNGLTVVGNESVTSPIGVLLAAAKPDEQCISALHQRCVINYIIAFLRFNNVWGKSNEWLCDRNESGVHVCCALHSHLTKQLYSHTVLLMYGADQYLEG